MSEIKWLMSHVNVNDTPSVILLCCEYELEKSVMKRKTVYFYLQTFKIWYTEKIKFSY